MQHPFTEFARAPHIQSFAWRTGHWYTIAQPCNLACKYSIVDIYTLIALGMVTAIAAGIWLVKFMLRVRAAHPIVDQSVMSKTEGYTALSARHANLVGRQGYALTDLKPNGYIDIGGDRIDAQSRGDFVHKGTPVRVVGSEGNFLIVVPEPLPKLEQQVV